ncbi:unnamed protein product [Trichogramma brassicae]|uniref:Uncharacterized protein n=1 Tax=Trichogramma brassicae TaxID=86971 RepID=A0A6H5IWG8_9HYME|nr:unnamed protein product [Trichogramma brassicae]
MRLSGSFPRYARATAHNHVSRACKNQCASPAVTQRQQGGYQSLETDTHQQHAVHRERALLNLSIRGSELWGPFYRPSTYILLCARVPLGSSKIYIYIFLRILFRTRRTSCLFYEYYKLVDRKKKPPPRDIRRRTTMPLKTRRNSRRIKNGDLYRSFFFLFFSSFLIKCLHNRAGSHPYAAQFFLSSSFLSDARTSSQARAKRDCTSRDTTTTTTTALFYSDELHVRSPRGAAELACTRREDVIVSSYLSCSGVRCSASKARGGRSRSPRAIPGVHNLAAAGAAALAGSRGGGQKQKRKQQGHDRDRDEAWTKSKPRHRPERKASVVNPRQKFWPRKMTVLESSGPDGLTLLAHSWLFVGGKVPFYRVWWEYVMDTIETNYVQLASRLIITTTIGDAKETIDVFGHKHRCIAISSGERIAHRVFSGNKYNDRPRDGSTRARLCCCCCAARSEPRTRRRNKLKRTQQRRRRRWLQPTPMTTKRTRLASSGTSSINIISLGARETSARRRDDGQKSSAAARLSAATLEQPRSEKNDYDEDAPPADYYYTVGGGSGDLPAEFRNVEEVLDDLAKQRLLKMAYSSPGQLRGGKKPLGYGQLNSDDDLLFNAVDSNSVSSNEDEYQQKRAYAQGFHSVRGRRSGNGPSSYYANGNLLDQLDEFEKRALLSGFQVSILYTTHIVVATRDELFFANGAFMYDNQSMRGKKDLVLEDLPLELGRYVAAKRRMLGFHGMRGKRSVAPNQAPRARDGAQYALDIYSFRPRVWTLYSISIQSLARAQPGARGSPRRLYYSLLLFVADICTLTESDSRFFSSFLLFFCSFAHRHGGDLCRAANSRPRDLCDLSPPLFSLKFS